MSTEMQTGYSRVSCSVFFRFTTDDEAKIILHRAYKGERTIMRPLGGSLRASSMRTIDTLKRGFGARGFDGGLDLRFLAPIDKINDIEGWFRTGKGRERNMRPLLIRQLSGDMRVLTRPEASQLQPNFAHFARHAGESSNPSARLKLTQYLIEVHDVEVSKGAMTRLVAASKGSIENRRLFFTTPQQIQEESRQGGFISSLALTLIQR